MENQAFYDDLFIKVKDSMKYQELQELKSFKKENIPLLEKKIQKLKSGKVFLRIVMFSILTLIILFAVLFQENVTPKLNHLLFALLMFFPIALSNAISGKKSLPALQKKIDTFEFMLVLTKNEWAKAG